MNIAIIPARGGSQRIPRKNIKSFHGKPIIAYSIQAALDSGLFEDVIVSTDNEDIAKIAKQYGASVPWMRPAALSDHHTPTLPVIQHGLSHYDKNKGIKFVCCIYATAPFITASLLQKAFKKISNSHATYCIPVCEFDYPIQRALSLNDKHQVTMMQRKHMLSRSQDLTPMYHDVGQFYFGTRDAWERGDAILGDNTIGLIIPRIQALDIDNLEDWILAEAIYSQVNHD